MRRVLVLALLMASACALARKPAWELPPPPARDAPVVQEGSLQRAELDNGLEVLVLEDHRLPRVVLAVTVVEEPPPAPSEVEEYDEFGNPVGMDEYE